MDAFEKAEASIKCDCYPSISECGEIRTILDKIRGSNLNKDSKLIISKVDNKNKLANDTKWVSTINGININGYCFKLSIDFKFIENNVEIKPNKYTKNKGRFSFIDEKGNVLLEVTLLDEKGNNEAIKGGVLFNYLAFYEDKKKISDLKKSGEISAKEIKEYRDYIKTLPEKERAEWYLELQKHVPYYSQLDNQCSIASGSVMCNVTSLAMNFVALGVENPSPSQQFEDWLGEQAGSKNALFSSATWKKLAEDKKIGLVATEPIFLGNSKQSLVSNIKPELEKGNSISLSLYPSCKGHIVRVQGIDDNGLWIDDPNGSCPLLCKLDREKCKTGYDKGKRNNLYPGAGNNNFYSWEELKQITVKYMVVFSEN